MNRHIKILFIFVLLVTQSYAKENNKINRNRTYVEYHLKGLCYKYHVGKIPCLNMITRTDRLLPETSLTTLRETIYAQIEMVKRDPNYYAHNFTFICAKEQCSKIVQEQMPGVRTVLPKYFTYPKYDLVPYSKKIPLSQRSLKNKGKHFAIVGYWIYDWLNQWKWQLSRSPKTIYVVRKENNRTIRLHRFIFGLTNSEELVDHKNHNGLDNTYCNIRIATRAQNNVNRQSMGVSGYLGVILGKPNPKNYNHKYYWIAQTKYKRKRIFIGCFPHTPEGLILAAKAYDVKAKELYGEFANLNFK